MYTTFISLFTVIKSYDVDTNKYKIYIHITLHCTERIMLSSNNYDRIEKRVMTDPIIHTPVRHQADGSCE